MINYKSICTQVQQIARETGKFIAGEREKVAVDKIEKKGMNDFVSYVDQNAERKIISSLEKLLPEAGFIAEEGTNNKKGERFNWIIDPLDGTTNFLHSLPPFSVSIALMENNEVVIGVVYEITQDECFSAFKDGGAFLNNQKIQVSNAPAISDSLVATGFPYYDFNRLEAFMKSLEYFMNNSHGVRRLGSAAADLAYLACGRFEVFYEYNLKPWDVAAGGFIVQQAGGKVSDFSGGDNYIFGKEIAAANNLVFNDFQKILQGFFEGN